MNQQLDLFARVAPSGRRNLVIEAGAGTGKTTAIVREVVTLLLENPSLEAERVVLITFTEKAAGEIADRIRDAMTELHLSFDSDRPSWPADSKKPIITIPREKRDEYRQACAGHLQRIDRLHSQTIHSFCQGILRSHPIEANLDPDFSIIQGYEQTRLYNQIYDEWLAVDAKDHRDEWASLYHHFHFLEAIRQAIFTLLPKRDIVADPRYSLGAIEEADETIRLAIKAIQTAAPEEVAKFPEDGIAFLMHVRETRVPYDVTLAAWSAYFEPVADRLEKTNLPQGGGKSALKEAVKLLRGDKGGGKSIVDRLRQQTVSMALRSTSIRFFRYLEDEKRRRAVVDFDDLLLRTLELLENREVLRELRERYLHLFVDEFQDTDRVQAQIIDKLARDEADRFVPGKMTIVGDPKQSIYSFRRADPESYGATVDTFIAGGARVDALRRQFRSDPPLVDSLNAMFSELFAPSPAQSSQVYRPPYEELEAAKSRSLRDLDARFTFLFSPSEDSIREKETSEAEAIASWILDRANGNFRRFAILFRKMTRVDDYLRVFNRCGIPTALPPARDLFEQPAVVDLLAVLRGIAYPFDAGCRISAARSPSFALSDDEIAAHFLRPRETRPEADGFTNVVDALYRYERDSRNLTVTALIDRILDESRIEQIYRVRRFGATMLEQLDRFRDIAIEYDRAVGGSIRQFVDEISRRKEAAEEAEPIAIDDGSNAVRVMTIHGAKGLEFETVILPDLGFQLVSERFRTFSVEDPPSLVFSGSLRSLSGEFREADGVKLSEIGEQREDAENERLLYVAITRAKSDVVFMAPREKKRQGFWKSLASLFRIEELDPVIPASPGRIVVDRTIGIRSVPVALERAAPLAAEVEPGRFLGHAEDLLQKEIAPAMEIARSSDRLEPAEAIRRRAALKNRNAGIMLHRVLELWDGDEVSLDSLVEKIAVEQGVSSAAKGIVRNRLLKLRQSENFARIMLRDTIGRELPLFRQREGRIDRLVVDEEGLLVVDYKSGEPYPARLETDREQIREYCAAVTSISGLPCRGVLWYIDVETDALMDIMD